MNGMWKWLDRYMWLIPLGLPGVGILEGVGFHIFEPAAFNGMVIVLFSVLLLFHCLLGLLACILLLRKGLWLMVLVCLLVYGMTSLIYFSVLWGPLNVVLR